MTAVEADELVEVDRAADLLAAVLAADGRLDAAELAQRRRLPPETAGRLLTQLEASGLVTRRADGRLAAGPVLRR
jgi:DNA-binding IclR family transcriptional regulator